MLDHEPRDPRLTTHKPAKDHPRREACALRLWRAACAKISGLDLPTTSTVKLAVPRRDVPHVQSEIRRVAEILEVEAIELEEKRGRVTSVVRVTLTARPDQIASFKECFGRTATGRGRVLDFVVSFLLSP
jgi:hypothetical protein